MHDLIIDHDTAVRLELQIANSEGERVDDSTVGQIVDFVPGQNMVAPGLERALLGKRAGETVTVACTQHEAYGPYREEKIILVARDVFADRELRIGQVFEADGPYGVTVEGFIVDFNDNCVTLDTNHPLAGMSLTFSARVCELRKL
jgi:FKBP-type peptidyl-prolyl cis-trans isomerase SlyD